MVAEAYRRRGYRVRENLSLGPDGGVDLALEKDGQLYLVQCKQWKSHKVGVSIVREMYGVMVAHNASSVAIISSGMFTQEAKNFAEDKPIDLIDGPELARLIANVQVPSLANPESIGAEVKNDLSISCPQCGIQLVTRTARRGRNVGKQFLGCSSFPTCKYTRERVE